MGINDANLSKKELAYKIKDHLPDLKITKMNLQNRIKEII